MANDTSTETSFWEAFSLLQTTEFMIPARGSEENFEAQLEEGSVVCDVTLWKSQVGSIPGLSGFYILRVHASRIVQALASCV